MAITPMICYIYQESNEIGYDLNNEIVYRDVNKIIYRTIHSDEDLIKEIIKRYVDNHEYVRGTFDCTEYTWELRDIFTKLGINTKIKIGVVDENNNYCFEAYRETEEYPGFVVKCDNPNSELHAWLEFPDLNLEMEATSGAVINKEWVR